MVVMSFGLLPNPLPPILRFGDIFFPKKKKNASSPPLPLCIYKK
jgi:hypothetical protein